MSRNYSRQLWRATICLFWGLFPCSFLYAQTNSRAALIQAARARKVQNLVPEEKTFTEKTLDFIEDKQVVERLTYGIAGFRGKLGGMISGSGFALGPEYFRRDLARGDVTVRGWGQSSFTGYRQFGFQLLLPSFAEDRLFLDFSADRHNYPRINYYGPGPDSQRRSRSNFRREGAEFNATVGLRATRQLQWGTSLGFFLVNVGEGTDPDLVSTDKAFGPLQAVGLDEQTNFFRQKWFAQFDYRDNSSGPRSGGNYVVEYTRYTDFDLERHDFQRLDVSLEQYVPFFNKRRIIALRGRTSLTFQDDDQQVPFYLQPTLGGPNDLRGFRRRRFYDDHSLVVNAEYRWETFPGMDMAVFADAGKVFSRRSQFNFADVEGSVGFGLRFNVNNSTFLRIDVGFSHENFQVWMTFGDIFGAEPVQLPQRTLIF